MKSILLSTCYAMHQGTGFIHPEKGVSIFSQRSPGRGLHLPRGNISNSHKSAILLVPLKTDALGACLDNPFI